MIGYIKRRSKVTKILSMIEGNGSDPDWTLSIRDRKMTLLSFKRGGF
jgi:hypothetical protein